MRRQWKHFVQFVASLPKRFHSLFTLLKFFFSCSLASFQNLHNLKIFFSEFLLFFFLVIIIQNVKHTAAQSMTTDGDMEQQYLGEDYLYISKVPAHTPILTTINKRVEHQEVRVSKSLKPNFIYCHLKLLLLL